MLSSFMHNTHPQLKLQPSSCKTVFSIKVGNSVDPDQLTLLTKSADLYLHCLKKKIYSGSARQGLKSYVCMIK